MSPAPAFSWTGLYAGGQFGGLFGSSAYAVPQDGFQHNAHDDGVLGGAHIGYNFQFRQFVLGVQAEFDGSTAAGTTHPAPSRTWNTSQRWLASIDERLGYAVAPRTLLYAIGGFAFGDSREESVVNDIVYNGANPSVLFSKAALGFDIGAGVEYALTDRWSIDGEYRFYDFGRQSYGPTRICASCGNVFYAHTYQQYDSAARVGVSYKFN